MTVLLLPPREAARRLGLSRAKLYELLKDGRLASVRIDGSRRVPLHAIEEFVAQLERAE